MLAITKGHNCAVYLRKLTRNLRKLTRNNLNLDLVNVNAYAKICLILSTRSLDIERKRKSKYNQGP